MPDSRSPSPEAVTRARYVVQYFNGLNWCDSEFGPFLDKVDAFAAQLKGDRVIKRTITDEVIS